MIEQTLEIPAEIVNFYIEGSISATEVLFYGYIRSIIEQDGECMLSNEELAETFSVSYYHASRVVSNLINQELLKVDGFDGRHRYLVLKEN